jgi:MIP family channel proteins
MSGREQQARTEPTMGRRLAAELFGTYALTLVAAGVESAAVGHPEIGHAERASAPALMVLALIYALSDVSGAHFNPAITLAFALRGAFSWKRVPGYWLAQLAGSLLAAATIAALFAQAARAGAVSPKVDALTAFATEALLTLLLASVAVNTSKRHAIVGPNAALAVAATIALCGFWGGPLTGAAINPARAFGPAILSGKLDVLWIYTFAPAAGAALAVALARVVHGRASGSEQRAAEGDAGGADGWQPQRSTP